jgi:hypothetical protein
MRLHNHGNVFSKHGKKGVNQKSSIQKHPIFSLKELNRQRHREKFESRPVADVLLVDFSQN